MELRLPLEMSPGRGAACRAVFGTWGLLPNDARKNCPFVLTSFTGWSSERCPGIGFLSRGDREIGVQRNVEPPTRPRIECAVGKRVFHVGKTHVQVIARVAGLDASMRAD